MEKTYEVPTTNINKSKKTDGFFPIRKTTEIRVRHVAYELPSSSSARDNAISKAKG